MNGEAQTILDLETLTVLRDAIGDDINNIISLYLNDVPNSLQRMQQALEQNDLVTVGRLAHSLKSSSASLGAMQISRLAAGLEYDISVGVHEVPKILNAIKSLQQSFDQISPLFRDYLK